MNAFCVRTDITHLNCKYYEILRHLFPSYEIYNIRYDLEGSRIYFKSNGNEYCVTVVRIERLDNGYNMTWRLYMFIDDEESAMFAFE